MIEGLQLRWTKASKGFRLIIPNADDLSIWKAQAAKRRRKRELRELARLSQNLSFASRLGIGQPTPPTTSSDEMSDWEAEMRSATRKHKPALADTGFMALLDADRPRPRFVPQGEPVIYSMRLQKAEEAFRFFTEDCRDPANAVEFYSRYGALTLSPPTRANDHEFRSREDWESGESQDQFYASWDGMQDALAKARRGIGGLVSAFDANNMGAFRIRLHKPARGLPYAIRFEPQHLHAMLWFMLAQAVTGDCTVRPCAQCGRPMVIGRGLGNRSNKKTCSDRCRMAMSRAEHVARMSRPEAATQSKSLKTNATNS
jgi:hypothetical protein